MQVMLDNCVFSDSGFSKECSYPQETVWGPRTFSSNIAGYMRKKSHVDPDQQREIDALLTIGRLIKEQRIAAFSYQELQFERFRGRANNSWVNAFQGCTIQRCDSPFERSKVRQTVDFKRFIDKGRKGEEDTYDSMSQISFVQWLVGLSEPLIESLLSHKETLHLSEFECDSLRNLPWFQAMCKASRTPNNYPDMLHIWAAQRNQIDVFLTLEKRLPNIVKRFPAAACPAATKNTVVLRPIELLKQLGIGNPDAVPIEHGFFYPIVGQPIPIGPDFSLY